jgi:glycosyltransferase involved in cell wall biosynthesis
MKTTQNPRHPSIAAIVPATDDPPTLTAALDALTSGSDAPDAVAAVRECTRPGPAAARNHGAASAAEDVLLFVDADVLVAADAVARIRRRFAEDGGLSAVFGAYDEDPCERGVVSRFRNLLHHHVHAEAAGPAGTFWSGLGAVRRAHFERIGGFDADRFPRASVEDVELGSRLTAGGLRIELDPAITGRHAKRWTLASMVSTDLLRRGLPWARLVLEGRAAPSGLNLGPRHRLSALASVGALAALLARRPRPALVCAGILLVANRRLYALLARVGGARLAIAGPPLHALHHLTGVVAAVAAVVAHLARRR